MGPYEIKARIRGSEEQLTNIYVSGSMYIEQYTGITELNAIGSCYLGPFTCGLERLKQKAEQSGCVYVSGEPCIKCLRHRRT